MGIQPSLIRKELVLDYLTRHVYFGSRVLGSLFFSFRPCHQPFGSYFSFITQECQQGKRNAKVKIRSAKLTVDKSDGVLLLIKLKVLRSFDFCVSSLDLRLLKGGICSFLCPSFSLSLSSFLSKINKYILR